MPRRLLSSMLGAVLLAGASAQAGTLTDATWLQATQGVPLTRTNAALGAAGNSTATSIAVTLSYPQFTTQFFVPKSPNGTLDLHVTVSQGGAQAITATAGMANGTPGIPGTVVIMTAKHAGMGVNQSMFGIGVLTLVAVPLSNGKAGQFTNTFTITGALHTITVDFYAWTPGSFAFYALSYLGDSLPPETVMGSFSLTPMGGGTVTLVSPSKVSIDGALAQRRTVSFTTLVLSFVPEPGTLFLLGGAALALAFGARRRRT